MIRHTPSYIALLAASIFLLACSSSRFDPIGRWISRDGYVVSLRSDNTYEFCDRALCSQGKLIRPGNPGGIAIILIDFFKKKNTARIAERLNTLYAGYNTNLRKSDDLDFTANSGVGSAAANEFCDWKPCVIYGNLEVGPNLTFTKVES
jgi:hypothetical protein